MVTISPPVFDLVFYAIVFLFGLDFSLSGFLVLRENSANLKRPRLIGLWSIRKMHSLYGSTNRSKLFSFIYSTKNMGIQTLFAGILVIIGSLIMIVDIVVRLI